MRDVSCLCLDSLAEAAASFDFLSQSRARRPATQIGDSRRKRCESEQRRETSADFIKFFFANNRLLRPKPVASSAARSSAHLARGRLGHLMHLLRLLRLLHLLRFSAATCKLFDFQIAPLKSLAFGRRCKKGPSAQFDFARPASWCNGAGSERRLAKLSVAGERDLFWLRAGRVLRNIKSDR